MTKTDQLLEVLEEKGYNAEAYDDEVVVFYENGMHHDCTVDITVEEDRYEVSSWNNDLEKGSNSKTVKKLQSVLNFVEKKVTYQR